MSSPTRILILPILFVMLIVGSPLAFASAGMTAGNVGGKIRDQVSKLRARRGDMDAAAWTAMQSDLMRLSSIQSELVSIGSEVDSLDSRIESGASRAQWLRIEAESAFNRYKQAYAALERDAEHIKRRMKSLDYEIERHNENKPNQYDKNAVIRYNSRARELNDRKRKLQNEWAQILIREAREVTPLRLEASKRERLFNEKRAEVLRLVEKRKGLASKFDGLVGEANRRLDNATRIANRGIDRENDRRADAQRRAQQAAAEEAAREAAAREARREAARDEIARIEERKRLLEAELRKVKARQLKNGLSQRELRELQWKSLRHAFEDLLALLNGERFANFVDGFRALTPANRQRVEAAVTSVKRLISWLMDPGASTDAKTIRAIIDTIADGQSVLVKLVADASTERGKTAIKQFDKTRDILKAAARLGQFIAEVRRKPGGMRLSDWSMKDTEMVGELLADMFGPFSKPLDVGTAVVKSSAHLGEMWVAQQAIGHLRVARNMDDKAAASLRAHIRRYEQRLEELRTMLE